MSTKHRQGLPLLVVLLGVIVGTPSLRSVPAPLQNAYVGVIGGSSARDIEISYKNVSTRDVTWSAAQANASLSRWATATAWVQTVDPKIAQFGQPTAMWWPTNIRNEPKEVQTLDAAWAKFLAAYALMRQRIPTAPLYMTPTLGNQPGCTVMNQALQDQLVDKATTEIEPATGQPYAIRSLPDIPPASHPLSGDCQHFNPIASTNVGAAAVQFLDQ